MTVLRYTVPPENEGCKLGLFLRLQGVTAGLIKSVKYDGDGFYADDQPIRTNEPVHAGQCIRFALPPEQETSVTPQPVPFSIAYEDDFAAVLNKPAGIAVHPTLNYPDGTLANGWLYHLRQRGKSGIFRPVNRIDKNTSGLVLCAKNAFAAPLLAGSAHKCYLAIVQGTMPLGPGRVEAPIARRGDSIIGRCVCADGKYSLTEYAVLILFYVMMAQMVLMLLPRAKVCLERIDAVLSHRPEITDGAGSLPQTEGEAVCAFQHAWFRFADADGATLQDLDFVLRRGQTTAIIGSTGSGKSTIAKLLLRFHDVTQGAICFDGADLRTLRQADLRQRIAYVPQKAWLFSGTVAENLRHGNPQAGEEDLRHALAVAQAGFVDSLPGGLQARVEQGGRNFSGGQKQRLAIARALTKRADLYIFDDSFSALDFQTDAALRRALRQEVAGSAVLIIAQRVSTIAHADQIIVLEDGRAVGIGRHEELLETCPVYREIAQSQGKGGEN